VVIGANAADLRGCRRDEGGESDNGEVEWMLRQLWRLSRTIKTGAGGPTLRAPAVYAERAGDDWRMRSANEMGYEGVACVDDAARLAVLLMRAMQDGLLPFSQALNWATETMEFLLYMQQPDGKFANFILDWTGEPNLHGPTSVPGGHSYQTRAMWALSVAYRATAHPPYREAYYRAVAALPERPVYADTVALAAYSVLESRIAFNDPELDRAAQRWCETVYETQADGLLLNHADEDPSHPHLWGYIQPGVLALASRRYGRPEWLEAARRVVDGYLAPLIEEEFKTTRTMPYETSSILFNCRKLHEAVGDGRYTDLGDLTRQWYHGRNAAREPVYNPEAGMVFDGTDSDRVSLNSGAESNIEGGFALYDELPWHLYRFENLNDGK